MIEIEVPFSNYISLCEFIVMLLAVAVRKKKTGTNPPTLEALKRTMRQTW
jgi:hypothetical protein